MSSSSPEELQNPNPIIFKSKGLNEEIFYQRKQMELDENVEDEIDNYEIFDIIRTINDPEHPLTLEQLNIVSPNNIYVDHERNYIKIYFTPTIPNCSMSTLIGLMIKVKLLNTVSSKYKIEVFIEPGKHYTEDAINKQLNDKERVYAALESDHLRKLVNKGIKNDDEVVEIFSQIS
jgi:metal-sulfur cluster biosynthetic enzyme